MMIGWAIAAAVLGACSVDSGSPAGGATVSTVVASTRVSATSTTSTSTTASTTSTTTTMAPKFPLEGRVFGVNGAPLGGATVTVGDAELVTGMSGVFVFPGVAAAPIRIERPAYRPTELEWDGTESIVAVTLEPIVARALRAGAATARDDQRFRDLLDLAAATAVDAIVFDTKKEGGAVLYETVVEEAHEIGAVVDGTYDPVQRIMQAQEAGLYTITRVVSFEDPIRARAQPKYRLAGDWIDPTNRETWEYPLALGVEACELGFDEIQFDYVRFPTGQAARQARKSNPTTQEERVTTIAGFLTEARDRLHPLGCAVGADVFGIVLSAPNDQGIGQRPEDFSGIVDVLSPMIYPSHYSPGWLGFADPNDYPGEVTADALDDGMPRVGGGTIVRPWLQAFYWSNDEILESIRAAERRGLGWMLWNAVSNYEPAALPTAGDSSEDEDT